MTRPAVEGIVNVQASSSRTAAPSYRLKVSNYDRAAGLVVALLILLGAAVFLLFVVWWTSRISLGQAAVPVQMVDLGTGEGPLGGGMELEGPTDLEIGLDEPTLTDTLDSIALAVDARASSFEELQVGEGGGSRGTGHGSGPGGGDGTGSGYSLQRELLFDSKTLNVYARQLDFFGIELGVVMPNDRVTYVYNLAKPQPDTRSGPPDREKYYFTWLRGELQQADRTLVGRAGVNGRGRIILKYLPREWELDLIAKEQAYGGREPGEIRKTVFAVRRVSDGYAFEVIDQTAK